MGLRDALNEVRSEQRMLRCSVGIVADLLDAVDREVFDEALADRSVLGTQLAAALQSLGHDVSPSALQRHRRGACRCRG